MNAWPYIIGRDFVLGNSTFGSIRLTKISYPGNYKYSDYGIGFDVDESFLLPNDSWFGKNVIIFGADISSFVHIDNKKKDIFILDKAPNKSIEDEYLTAENEHFVNFTVEQKKVCLTLHCNGVNLLMVLKYKNSKQKILKQMHIHYA